MKKCFDKSGPVCELSVCSSWLWQEKKNPDLFCDKACWPIFWSNDQCQVSLPWLLQGTWYYVSFPSGNWKGSVGQMGTKITSDIFASKISGLSMENTAYPAKIF